MMQVSTVKAMAAGIAVLLTMGSMVATGVGAFYSLKGDVRVMKSDQMHIRSDIAEIKTAVNQIVGDSRVRASASHQ